MPPAAADILANPGFFVTYAVLQSVAVLLLVRLFEPFERPPLSILSALLIWGGTGAAIIALAGNEAVKSLLPGDARQVFGDSIAPPVIEECAKGLALVFAVLASQALIRDVRGWRFDGAVAGMICGAAVGIGFAFTEDFFYFVNHATNEGVQVGADIYLGRRDFFGPTALHHPLFTAALGAGIGAATESRTWRGRIGWPTAGLAIAIFMHAVNNGLVELLLVLRHGLDAATAWVSGAPVSSSVDQTADNANSVLLVLDYVYIVAFVVVGLTLHRRTRLAVAGALEADVRSGLISEQDRREVCGFATRPRARIRLFFSGQRDRLRRTRDYEDEVAGLGIARLRAGANQAHRGSLAEARRRLIAAAGVAREPGSVEAPELAMLGRQAELAELTELLSAGTRQLTITGPGGTGKTRIALELASRAGRDFASGAYFVDLSTALEHGQVASAVTEALEVSMPPDVDPGDWLGRLMRDRELLLVLDNFEHVLNAAPLLTTFLRTAPRLRVVVTSRIVLGRQGETEYKLGPLGLGGTENDPSAAASLFMTSARRAGTELGAADQLSQIEQICERLDGLPLAIELVAARTRVLTLEALLKRLDRTLDLAATGSTMISKRQRTLRGTVSWSEELLGAEARGLFLDVAAFSAGCRLDVLERETGSTQVLEDVQKLVEASLLQRERDPDGETRCRMLATIRDYALEQRSQRSSPGRVSLVRYCEALAQTAAPNGGWLPTSLPILDLERPNILQAVGELREGGASDRALELMVDLGPLWETGGIGEARRQLAAVMSDAEDGSHLILRGRHLSGRLAMLQGDYREAASHLRPTLEASETDERLRFACLWELGWVQTFLGRLEPAEATFSSALPAARDLGKPQLAQASLALGRVKAERGDVEAGHGLLDRGLCLWQEEGDQRGAASATSSLARIAVLSGDAETGETQAREALERSRELGDRLREAEAMFPLATALLLLERIEEAAGTGAERLAICRDLGDQMGIAEVLDLGGLLMQLLDRRSVALDVIASANAVRERTGGKRWPFEQSLIDTRLRPRPSEPKPYSAALDLGSAIALAGDTLHAVLSRDSPDRSRERKETLSAPVLEPDGLE